MNRFLQGLGQVGRGISEGLFPVAQEVGSQLDPRTVEALRRQAMMQLGLGMMAAKERGAGLGQGINQALAQSQEGMGQGLGQAYVAKRAERDDRRIDLQDRRIRNAELQQDQDRLQSRIDAERARLERKQQFEAQQANVRADNERAERQFQALQEDRSADRSLAERRLDEQQKRERETQEKNDKRFISSTRKEFRSLPPVKAYETVLPILQSAKNAPDNGYGDLDLIYSVGKTLDPGSVVREGELALTIKAGSPMHRILGQTRFVLDKGGRLDPTIRKQIVGMLENRVDQYRLPYEQARTQYERYAVENQVDPFSVVGDHAQSAFGPQVSPAAPTPDAAQQLDSLMGQYGRQ